MHLNDNIRLVLGIIFAIVGAGILVVDRSSRGFGQRRQIGVLFLVGGLLLLAVSRGLIHI